LYILILVLFMQIIILICLHLVNLLIFDRR